MGCFEVAEFLLTSALRGPSAIAEPLVQYLLLSNHATYPANFIETTDFIQQIQQINL